ncbi:hypothetical protein [uncultured Clostridium sp.]|uniref:hypothetical protein n=1 Tax=uncultured Clostridium sp. TaxID=59620 RepID=UPI00262D985A|nr:hypothetical protein [uncultured Clostridium sp.]
MTAKQLKLTLSFKQNEKWLYDYLLNKLSTSIYVKELIIEDIEKNGENIPKTKSVEEKVLNSIHTLGGNQKVEKKNETTTQGFEF